MRKRSILSSAVVAAVAFIVFSIGLRAENDTSSLEGKAAPDFSLKTLAGDNFKLSELKGSVVVLDFWATSCPPCREALPHLNRDASDQALAKQGLKVFAVNCGDPADKVKTFLESNNLHFNVPLDPDQITQQKYVIEIIPTTVVIGRDGVIRKVFIGFKGAESENALDAAIDAALKEPNDGK